MITEEEINKRFLLQEEHLGREKPVNKLVPVVSVLVTAYQHHRYIEKCLNGILMQNTNFDFEIVLGEDQSNDGTREICIAYAEKFPDKIRLFLRDRKLSALHDEKGDFKKSLNSVFNRMSARGKYIAICEGDDYWIDPYKLQKQVDCLETHPECSMCFHDVISIWEGKTYLPGYFCPNDLGEMVTIEDVMMRLWFIHISSILVHKHVIDSLPEWMNNVWCGDLVVNLWCAHHGNLIYLNEIMSVYRRHLTGLITTTGRDMDSVFPVQKYIYREFDRETNYKYTALIAKVVKRIDDDYQYHKIKKRWGALRFIIHPDRAVKMLMIYLNIIRLTKWNS